MESDGGVWNANCAKVPLSTAGAKCAKTATAEYCRVGGVMTAYVGNHFEWTGSVSTMKRYYYAGGSRVAMRTGASTVNYLLSDHLGSTAVVTNDSGVRTSEVRYMPFGSDRYTYGTTPTTMRYTGQRQESSIGLYFYGARWYDSALGRFTSPDSIIPAQQGVMGNDRYAYANNNPLIFSDPSGHFAFLVTGLIGASVGFTANYVAQTIGNLREGKSFAEAVSWGSMDKRDLVASTVGGAVAGLTMGVASVAIASIGLTASVTTATTAVVGGAFSSVAGGQAEALTSAAYDQVAQNTTLSVTSDDRHVVQFSPNGSQFISDAQAYGFGNSSQITNDAKLGALVGFTVYGGQAFTAMSGAAEPLVLGAKSAWWVGPLSRGIDYLGDAFEEYVEEHGR